MDNHHIGSKQIGLYQVLNVATWTAMQGWQTMLLVGQTKEDEKSATKVLYDVSCLGGLDSKCSWLPLSTLEACQLWVTKHIDTKVKNLLVRILVMKKIRALQQEIILHQVIILKPHKCTMFHKVESPLPRASR